MKTVGLTSLGCPRNLLDSEVMLGSLKELGWKVTDADKGADVCIINTCAFIEEARKESVETILEAVQHKKDGKVRHLVVCGCLPQLYKKNLSKELPEIDLILGTNDFSLLAQYLKGLNKGKALSVISQDLNYLYNEHSSRHLLTPKHYAYVKISEGCSNFCSYCIISRLRGSFRSRSIPSIVEEAKKISKGGNLKEIDLIGQDTTLFGIDRYGCMAFADLLKRLCELKNNVKWIRIMYTHPAHYTDELIRTIREEKKICKYLDLPMQHISDHILKKMNRRITKKDIILLINRLRKNIPGLTLRTSIIVGFPGETRRDFKELLQFIKDTRFERLGAFIYSKEEGTRAAGFKDQIPEKEKKARLDELMQLQKAISGNINKSFLGRKVEVLIDEKDPAEADKYLGRTEGDAPEIDGIVYVTGKCLKIGEFYRAKITDTLEYDLVGEVN